MKLRPGSDGLPPNEWVAGIAQGYVVKVSVADVRVEHEVKLRDFTTWLEKKGGSPREVTFRHESAEQQCVMIDHI
jgi:hypothetical protein